MFFIIFKSHLIYYNEKVPFCVLKFTLGTSLTVLPFQCRDVCSIPDHGAKIPHTLRPKKLLPNLKQKQYYNKFNKALKTSR